MTVIMADLPITGGCYCGEIRYRVTTEPHDRTICYCDNCRRAIGSQSVAWLIDCEGFTVVTGSPTRFRTETNAWRTFCATCGTSLTYQHDDQAEHDRVDVTVGSLDHPERFPPQSVSWEGERLSWEREPIESGR